MNGKALFYINGTLVADAEEVKVGSGSLVKFRLAWNEKRKGESIASFANFESWSDYKNEHILKFFKKGKNVHVRGSLSEDTYEDKNGNSVRTYRFRVDDFDLLDNRNEGERKMDEGPGF
jgi:single-stranded DNA-binding protein